VEDSNSKVVVDIGNKFTWVITPVFYIHRHYTLFGIPKMPANNGVDWYVPLLSTVSVYNKFWTEGACTIAVTVVIITTCTPDEHFADFEVMGSDL
jgi:hypothetical protein